MSQGRGMNQKLKLLYLARILQECTDENHSITMPEIIAALEEYDIAAERKSIYTDLEALRDYGLDIVGKKIGSQYFYHIGRRQFELAELKLLVDSVQSSKFITAKKSNELIQKIEGFTSKYEGSQLQRQVFVRNRIKTMNETIYHNVDLIHTAINQNVKIKFQYYKWNIKKEPELRHGGKFYQISPWGLSWDDENYYMVGYDSEAGHMKHFRVDKMLKIAVTTDRREGQKDFKNIDMADYSRKMFGMFDGEEQIVKIQCENDLIGIMIDRFGKDITVFPVDEEHIQVNVKVAVSAQFLGWIFALGNGVKIVGPESVMQKVEQEIKRITKLYSR